MTDGSYVTFNRFVLPSEIDTTFLNIAMLAFIVILCFIIIIPGMVNNLNYKEVHTRHVINVAIFEYLSSSFLLTLKMHPLVVLNKHVNILLTSHGNTSIQVHIYFLLHMVVLVSKFIYTSYFTW
jgi:hypothetical protein